MHGQVVRGADDDELVRAFKQVKTAPFDLGNHGFAPDFALYVADCPPDDTATLRRLGAEKLVKEGGISANEPGFTQLNLSHP